MYKCISYWFAAIYILASLRNLGERASNLFSRKKKNAEQNAQDIATDIDRDVSKAALNVNEDVDNVATSTG